VEESPAARSGDHGNETAGARNSWLGKVRRRPPKQFRVLRFIITFFLLLAFDHFYLDRTRILEYAALAGYDVANARDSIGVATHTVVVGISELDIAARFGGTRPVPAESLLSVIDSMKRLAPAGVVVDVFTDNVAYAGSAAGILQRVLAPNASRDIVWATDVDTSSGELLPPIGGTSVRDSSMGLAAFFGDPDQIIRHIRPRHLSPSGKLLLSLPLAGALMCAARCKDGPGIPSRIRAASTDTGSVALRSYKRYPPVYMLGDLEEFSASDSAVNGKIVILGFVDGSDQVQTPFGLEPGPVVVANAIETILDTRQPVRRLPFALELLTKAIVGVIVVFFGNYFLPRACTILLVGVIILHVQGAAWLQQHGYWVNFTGMILGFWIDRLLDDAIENAEH
jgi:CHASE2 domain-containing sensor protein